MTAPDYREQADEMLNEPCFGGEGHATEPGEWGRTFFKKDCRACLASWASRIAEEEREACVRAVDRLMVKDRSSIRRQAYAMAGSEIKRRGARVSGGEGGRDGA